MNINRKYRQVPADQIPAGIRWDLPRRHQGQIVEISYADERPMADEADVGSRFRRILDRSDNSVNYAERVGPEWLDEQA